MAGLEAIHVYGGVTPQEVIAGCQLLLREQIYITPCETGKQKKHFTERFFILIHCIMYNLFMRTITVVEDSIYECCPTSRFHQQFFLGAKSLSIATKRSPGSTRNQFSHPITKKIFKHEHPDSNWPTLNYIYDTIVEGFPDLHYCRFFFEGFPWAIYFCRTGLKTAKARMLMETNGIQGNAQQAPLPDQTMAEANTNILLPNPEIDPDLLEWASSSYSEAQLAAQQNIPPNANIDNDPAPQVPQQPQVPVLDVSGYISFENLWVQFNMAAQSFWQISDRRSKKNIKPTNTNKNERDLDKCDYEYLAGDTRTRTGVIAQRVKNFCPETIGETSEGMQTVDNNQWLWKTIDVQKRTRKRGKLFMLCTCIVFGVTSLIIGALYMQIVANSEAISRFVFKTQSNLKYKMEPLFSPLYPLETPVMPFQAESHIDPPVTNSDPPTPKKKPSKKPIDYLEKKMQFEKLFLKAIVAGEFTVTFKNNILTEFGFKPTNSSIKDYFMNWRKYLPFTKPPPGDHISLAKQRMQRDHPKRSLEINCYSVFKNKPPFLAEVLVDGIGRVLGGDCGLDSKEDVMQCVAYELLKLLNTSKPFPKISMKTMKPSNLPRSLVFPVIRDWVFCDQQFKIIQDEPEPTQPDRNVLLQKIVNLLDKAQQKGLISCSGVELVISGGRKETEQFYKAILVIDDLSVAESQYHQLKGDAYSELAIIANKTMDRWMSLYDIPEPPKLQMDHVDKLFRLVHSEGLPVCMPRFATTNISGKFTSRVFIRNVTFEASKPFDTEAEADNEAALIALQDLYSNSDLYLSHLKDLAAQCYTNY